jgi:group I intron endonuclease
MSKSLKRLSLINVECIAHVESEQIYIGSSVNLGDRLLFHIFNYSSNIHLQRAIALYGLPTFIFIVIEFCKPQDVVAREQYYLNWLFSLHSNLRYNFNPVANMPPLPTPETKANKNYPTFFEC